MPRVCVAPTPLHNPAYLFGGKLQVLIQPRHMPNVVCDLLRTPTSTLGHLGSLLRDVLACSERCPVEDMADKIGELLLPCYSVHTHIHNQVTNQKRETLRKDKHSRTSLGIPPLVFLPLLHLINLVCLLSSLFRTDALELYRVLLLFCCTPPLCS